jgi:diaminopimelate epimerase
MNTSKKNTKNILKFTKMHGLGNDFVVINALTANISLSPTMISKIANRNFGIGCDQILVLEQPFIEHQDADFGYRIFNADGSEAWQCGNGVRCLAKFVTENGLSTKKELTFATKFRKLPIRLEENKQITVNIGKPIFEPKHIPFTAKKQELRYSLLLDNYGKIEIGAVSVGNPHAVVLLDNNIENNNIDILGPIISNYECFPEKINVNFMQIINPNQIKLWVYERGSGKTLACGSGACASVVIGKLWGLLNQTVVVELPGGKLLINWSEEDNNIYMTGPAEQVFNGEIIINDDEEIKYEG